MIKVFIVRPFGTRTVLQKAKDSTDYNKVSFDFDRVEKELIRPAMKQLGLFGGTTGEIRQDMFSSLLQEDLVIADITIHNANVFYELGIRHALRDQKTILLKCPGFDETPFDIIGYRYITYDKDQPATALLSLIAAITETLSDQRVDSPVFNTLPRLIPQDPEKYLALPEDFIVEVKLAASSGSLGKLALLAWEAESFFWKRHAWRFIGEVLYQANAYLQARHLWEEVLDTLPVDQEANDRLATIYQRLAEQQLYTGQEQGEALLTKSDLAIGNLLGNNILTPTQRAEAFALCARNAKTRWYYSWKDLPAGPRQKTALRSGDLKRALEVYHKGFSEDLNHYYAGINVLGLLAIKIALAEKDSKTWQSMHASPAEAAWVLENLKIQYQQLVMLVQLSIKNAQARAAARNESDGWANITEADLICLTTDDPERVVACYETALDGVTNLNKEAVLRQLKMYEALGVKTANVLAVINNIEVPVEGKVVHTFLFTGHMIDTPDRPTPRFPKSKHDEVLAHIRAAVSKEKDRLGTQVRLTAIAGGACGGDIIFQEVCRELNIASTLYLSLPRQQYVAQSVAFAGPHWIDRFDKLYLALPHPELNKSSDLPRWLQKKPDYSLWRRNNFWQLHSALVGGGINMTMFALWDHQAGDGPGGTAEMVTEAQNRGAKVILIEL